MAFVSLALSMAPSLTWADGGGNPDEAYRFDIEAGEAAFRLNEFSTQSGFQVLFPFADMKGVSTTPVHGDMKPFDALKKMIAGTGIRYQYSRGKSITVTLTMAQTDSAPQGTAVPKVKALSRAHEKDRRVADSGLDEVTIRSQGVASLAETGSRPISLTRADIDAPAFITVPDVVRTLPQVFGGGPTEDTYTVGVEAQSNNSRGVGINLRGLDAGSTLVLMNGRRLPGSGTLGLYVDVSNLPLAAVERVDILPDASSTFYGADAVGGVVNFVMRDRFEGWESEGYFGTTTQDRLNQNYVSQLFGTNTAQSHSMLAFDFFSRDNLAASSRDQARSDLRAFGGTNFDSLQSGPGNIVLGNTVLAVPRGQDGTSLTAADFIASAPNGQNRYAGADILSSQQRWSVFGTHRYEFSDSVDLFADALFTRRNNHGNSSGYASPLMVPTSNAFFPEGFTTTLPMQYSFLQDLGPMLSTGRVTSNHLSGGLDWKLGNSWSITTAATYASERVRVDLENQVNQSALARALADSDPATAFNPFSDGSNTNIATLEGLRANALSNTRSDVMSGGVTGAGPMFSIFGNDMTLTLGADWRRQEFRADTFSSAANPNTSQHSAGDRTVTSYFAELQVPLVGHENSMRGIHSLDLSFAERLERYDDFGKTLAPRLGLAWVPVNGLTLRSTYSESFRPPGLLSLDESTNAYAYYPTFDPKTGQNQLVLLWAGNNRDLREENAHSWTAGIELESPEHRGNAIAFTYFNTAFVDRMSSSEITTDLLSNESLSDLVTRDPSEAFREEVCSRAPKAGSVAPCLSLPVVAIVDLRNRNDASVKTSGLDLLARYERDSALGRLSFNVNGTYILRFAGSTASYLPLVNRVSTPSNPVNLRMRSSARWEYGPFSLSAYGNYQNDYTDKSTAERRHIASWTTFDLHASYQLNQALLDGTTLSLGVDNLFDRSPPFVNNVVGIGYDQENGDLIGRVVSLSIRKKW